MRNEYIKSPLNYIGNKYKLLPQLIPLFPKNINTFVDVFGGSGTVLINVDANNYIYNDNNYYIADIFKGLVFSDIRSVIENINSIINTYELSKTNKVGFEKLRDDYNNSKNDWITLYTLMCFSFNYQYRFNSQHQYNSSFGKDRSCFSDNQRHGLYSMKKRLDGKQITVSKVDFTNIELDGYTSSDFFYFDPPYYNSVGNYNDGKRGFDGWTDEQESRLYKFLDELDRREIKFALSNNLKCENPIRDNWICKNSYKIHKLNNDYDNCNYHKKDRSKDTEILITNY